jgi:hypothetical protein
MDLELTPKEQGRFVEALLSAFPDRNTLKHIVYFELGVDIDQTLEGGAYAALAAQLVRWANDNGKAGALLEATHTANPGNTKLHKFYMEITARSRPLPQPDDVETRKLLQRLIEIIEMIRSLDGYEVHSGLLVNIPGANVLSRNATTSHNDLVLIVNQLHERSRLAPGNEPLLLFIETVLPFFKGLMLEAELKEIEQKLSQIYKRGS